MNNGDIRFIKQSILEYRRKIEDCPCCKVNKKAMLDLFNILPPGPFYIDFNGLAMAYHPVKEEKNDAS